jgi:hypothetical protein
MLRNCAIPLEIAVAACLLSAVLPLAAEGVAPDYGKIQPLFQKYCIECHNPDDKKGGVDLKMFDTEAKFVEESSMIEYVEEVMVEEEMPPRKAKLHPTDDEREMIIAWSHGLLKRLENAAPNDPGVVISPRINSQEYDYVARDLTGRPLEMSQYLTADSSAGEGFMNVGAAQPMQVGNFESFLAVGKKLLEHARIVPGQPIQWSDSPLPPAGTNEELGKALTTTYADWFDGNLTSIIDRQLEDLKKAKLSVMEAHIEAAWQYQNRAALGMPAATFADIADAYQVPLFPGAVEKTWLLMTNDSSVGVLKPFLKNPLFLAMTQQFEKLPPPRGNDKYSARNEVKAIASWHAERVGWHNEWGHVPDPLEEVLEKSENQALRGGSIPKGIYTYRLDLTRMKGKELFFCVSSLHDGIEEDVVLITDGQFEFTDGQRKKMSEAVKGFITSTNKPVPFGFHVKGAPVDDNTVGIPSGGYVKLIVPDGAKKLQVTMRIDQKNAPKTSVQTLITETTPKSFEGFPNRWVLGDKRKNPAKESLNQLSEWTGVFPNFVKPDKLIPVLLDETQRKFLGYTEPLPRSPWPAGYLYAVKPSDIIHRAPASEQEKLKGLMAGIDSAAKSTTTPLANLETDAARIIGDFATKAWRRPLNDEEKKGLMDLYRYEAGKGSSYEAAVKTPLTAVLASPVFLYRFSSSKGKAEPYPIAASDLATKLAFVFWASLPDKVLLDLAQQGKLHDDATLKAQVKRMIADPRARGFVDQFAGNWLRFAGFESFSGPDSMVFAEFDDSLKSAMNEEVVLFFLDLFQSNKPITLALDSDYSFLNEQLAKHYGITGVKGDEMRVVKIPKDQRGGVLGMGAFLTKFSAPLRTSPVNRGVWAYEQVLGNKLGEPPPNVPQLSDTPKNAAGLTVAQQLAEHRDNPSCFSCHDKFDPMGVALESFDPIGRWRTDIEGSPVDNLGKFGSGKQIAGFSELKAYMMDHKDKFTEAFCRKLLAYSLGRSIMPSDKPLLTEMAAAVKAANYTPGPAFDLLVTSQQFRFRRDELTAANQKTTPTTN